MKVTIEISAQRIADIMCSAVEHNHMTRAWCNGVYPIGTTAKQAAKLQNWYAQPEIYEGTFLLHVVEVLDESKEAKGANLKRHPVNRAGMVAGIKLMAEKHGRHFGDWLCENDDAVTADVFLQCIALRDVVYG